MKPDPRYEKQIRFAPIGAAGQERLASANVLLVGVGALGTHTASALARAGVGTLVLVDRDVVELGNLQRQVLYTEADAEQSLPKAIAAANQLRAANSSCRVHSIVEDFTPRTFAELPATPDLILDGTDNFATRYILNDLAVRGAIPWIYGGAVAGKGTAMVIQPGAPCLRCIMPEPPPTGEVETCETVGILEPAAATVAAFQTAEALKILSGNRAQVTPGVLTFDLWGGGHATRLQESTPLSLCPACGTREFPALQRSLPRTIVLCGRQAVQVHPPADADVDLDRLAANLTGAVQDLERTPHLLRFRAEDCSFRVFPTGRTLLLGVDEPRRARTLYDRYVGA